MKTSQPIVEWPTLYVMLATYLAFGLGTTWVADVSQPLAILITGIAIAQFSSLQHEVLHGHPFRHQWLNEATVFPGIPLFVPYLRFKDTHLAHHHDPLLTDPYDDPESNYLDPNVWNRLPKITRMMYKANNTLFGRIVIGPAISIVSFTGIDLRAMLRGDRQVQKAWVQHLIGVAMVMGWLWATGGMPVWAYVLAAYLGFGLLKVRTFLEHRAHDLARARSVVIEDKGFFALLFLNNNYHALHHCQPALAWYKLPRFYAQNRDLILARNDGYSYPSYAHVFKKYFFHAKDPVAHPIWTAPAETAAVVSNKPPKRRRHAGVVKKRHARQGTPAAQ